jgi:hypothetical protein
VLLLAVDARATWGAGLWGEPADDLSRRTTIGGLERPMIFVPEVVATSRRRIDRLRVRTEQSQAVG